MRGSVSSPEIEIRGLRERIAILEEENQQLRDLLAPSIAFPVHWGLTAQQAAFLAALYVRPGAVSYDALRTAVLGRSDAAKCESHISVVGYKIRKKVRPYGVEFRTIWDFGFALTAESRDAIAAAISAEQRRAA